jgi:AcrR family transcriptional regulator
MAQKTKRDWWLAGTELLTSNGPQGLTIEALCQRLGVTKGSFYHHFNRYDDFRDSLLEFYEAEGTLEIIDQLADLPTPQAKIEELIDIVVKASTAYLEYPEAAIRAWSYQDESVKIVMARVDKQRLDYVQSLCAQILGDDDKALITARMLYTILVGSEQIEPALHGDDLRALFDQFLQLLYGY